MEDTNSNEPVDKTFFQNTPIPSFILDERFRLIEVNHSFCNLLKCSSKDYFETPLADLFFDTADKEKIIDRLRVDENVSVDAISLVDKNNDVKRIRIEVKKMNHGDLRFFGSLYLEDSSGCDEDQLFEETLNNTRQIARSIGHEIRNPLTNLTLAIDQLEEELTVEEDNQLYFNIINRNALRIEQFIVDMLEAIKVVEIHPVLTDINHSLSGWITKIKDEVDFEGINLQIQLQNDLSEIEIDPQKTYLAFGNIIRNACKAVKRSKSANIKVSTYDNKDHIIIEVEDNGVGISRDDISKVFTPFFTGVEKWGSGLGLTSAKNAIMAQKGSIQLQSKLGTGTKFFILLRKYFR
ncbi:MAG: PAS domain-containing sensor histidine kinase [Bacteroidota bacterium]